MDGSVFTLLPPAQPRWKSFTASWGMQALFLLCLAFSGARLHQEIVSREDYRVTNLVFREPVVLTENPPVARRVLPRAKTPIESLPIPNEPIDSKPIVQSEPTPVALIVTPQRKVAPKIAESEPAAPAPAFDSKLPMIPAAPTSQVVAVGTFSHNSPVTAPVAKLAAVQASGFGNSDGNGPVRSKGTGTGTSGVVASAGFGNGAIDTANSGVAHRKNGLQPVSSGANAPVEITFKPKPDYTDEGRKQKISGEVRLEVLFRSDGAVHVVRVLQGLGYGLDEQAVKAAEQIKFKPALHQGEPVDSTALVHIIFELAS
jgi:TonB family protein